MEVFVPYRIEFGTHFKNSIREDIPTIFDEKFIDKYLTKNVGKEVKVSAPNLQLMNYMDPNCKYEKGLRTPVKDYHSVGTITFVGKLGVTIETTERIAEAIKKDEIQIAILNFYNSIDPTEIIKAEIYLSWYDKDEDVSFIL